LAAIRLPSGAMTLADDDFQNLLRGRLERCSRPQYRGWRLEAFGASNACQERVAEARFLRVQQGRVTALETNLL
jgi:hypothetical protein